MEKAVHFAEDSLFFLSKPWAETFAATPCLSLSAAFGSK